ncbi:N(6)-adenine-specific methyltransferase METTL4 [Cololabis saira]|uniref:N(6)-adenine-specific methyltransferase METTL4 n=1 Tax=Cololabis saira TaxID=129043 RepID=UPI002AD408C3|nr:N(6)-adenine-specific methyltransferase METTL4 [Cololabis saira]
MSVVLRCSSGCLLDSRPLIERGWRSENRRSHARRTFRRRCFQLVTRRYDQSAAASVSAGSTDVSGQPEKPAKKRKRKRSELNQGEIDSLALHEKVRSVILDGTKVLVDLSQSSGYLNGEADSENEPLPLQECGLAALCEMAKELPLVDGEEQEEFTQSLVGDEGSTSHVDLFSRVTENKEDWAAVVSLMGEEYVIPPHSAFLLSDLTRIQPLVQYGKTFDLIVMDPPWENKSVKRSRRYNYLPSSQLKRLPIPQLASPNCLVVTWVTNRPSHLRFVCDELYPHWGVQVVAKWFWIKVTTSGQFVFPLDSQHKKPYETLVLGRCNLSANTSASTSEMPELPVEDNRLIVSVPSALHSQKPSLSEVLRPYIGPEAECLELFARNLQPGWTSWGNEVLKFQHTSYFTLTPADDQANTSKDDFTDEPTDPQASNLSETT